MAQVDRTGITPTDLTTYRQVLEERFRERFGQDLALEPETPAGQIIGIMALSLAEIDEAIVFDGNGRSVQRSSGTQLHDLGSLLGIVPRGADTSSVNLVLTGIPGTRIPAGSRVRTNAGAEFATALTVTIGSSGSIGVSAFSIEEGPIEAPAGTLTNIVTLISGWETVTNPSDATLGRQAESDADFRSRYQSFTGRLAATPIDALTAALADAGVTRQRIEENFTDAEVSRQGLTIGAHSIMCIVQGGPDDSIAAHILSTKGLGVGMSGSTVVGDARFQRVTETPLAVTLTTTPGLRFPADGVAQIRANLVDYVSGRWTSGVGDFETDGLGIGDTVDRNRLLGPVTAVPGHQVSNLQVRVASSGILTALPAIPTLNNIYTLAADSVTINLT